MEITFLIFALLLFKVFVKFILKFLSFALFASYAKEVQQKTDEILKNNGIAKQKNSYLAKNLGNPETPLFYELPR